MKNYRRPRLLKVDYHKVDEYETTGQDDYSADAENENWEHIEPVAGNALLDDLVTALRRYVVLPKHAAVAVALWIVFAHAIDAFQVAPILNLWSPVRRCGKTRALKVLSRLVPNAKPTSNITA